MDLKALRRGPSVSWLSVAECGGQLVAFALCCLTYCTWRGCAYYLEGLYLGRGGVARRFVQEICKMAVEEGVQRIDGHVLKSNVSAISLYTRLGARDLRYTEGRSALHLHRRIEAVAKRHIRTLPQGQPKISKL